MLLDPLHPAMVHMPIALAVLLPFFAIGALLAIRRGAKAAPVWRIVVLLVVVMSVSSMVAVKTGEDQEDAVEEVVDHDIIHEHEELGERLRLLSWITVVVSVVGLAGGTMGLAGRGLTVVLAGAMAATAVSVGHSGGELVYVHGAASAYVTESGAPGVPARETEHDSGEDSDD